MSVLSELEKRKFAKAIKVDEPEKQPVTTYGYARSSNTVQVDGFDGVTPCSASVKMLPGDRVRLVISDHGILVTDNIDKPATDDEYAVNAVGNIVRQVNEVRADTGKFGTIFAEEADVYVLVAENATVEQINAANAEIERLNANNLTAQRIDVTEGTIGLLQADGIEAETISAKCITVTSEAVQDLTANIATIHDMRADIADLIELKADKADIASLEALSAQIDVLLTAVAVIESIGVDTLVANQTDIEKLKATSMHADFANFDSAYMDAAKIASLLAKSGWFENLEVTGDATITGQLKSVLIDGDTVRFKNIYADALKLLGQDGLYHALNFLGLDESKHAVYEEVEHTGGRNPSEEGWFELVTDSYKLTDDEEAVSGTTYYSISYSYALTQDESLDQDKTYYEPNYSYVQTQDASITSDKTYYTPDYSYAPTEDESLGSGKTYYVPTYSYAQTEDESLDEDKTYYIQTYSYALTGDESLDPDKTYYVFDNDVYEAVLEPDVADIATYYERSVSGFSAVSEPDVEDIGTYYERSVSGYSAVQSPDVSDISGYYERSVTGYSEVSSPVAADIATYYEYAVTGYSAVSEPDISDIATYYERSEAYTVVTPGSGDDPSEEGWYVPDETHYAESEDTTATSGSTYYLETMEYTDSETKALFDSYGESLDGGLHGSHIIAETITADQIDATSVRAALLEVLNIVVGLRDGFHIEIESDTAGGSMNFVSGKKTVPNQPWSYTNANGIDNQGNRIAYLQADNSGDSLFYMNKAVVMNDLRFARWQWKARRNGNLTLKWVG